MVYEEWLELKDLILRKDPFLLESWDMSLQSKALPLYKQRDGNDVESLESSPNHYKEPSRIEQGTSPLDELDTLHCEKEMWASWVLNNSKDLTA